MSRFTSFSGDLNINSKLKLDSLYTGVVYCLFVVFYTKKAIKWYTLSSMMGVDVWCHYKIHVALVTMLFNPGKNFPL